ncbi:winged helix-turn-helix transcriptional regulator [Nocardiopsis sp. HNM0947]|uniref:Winged helix-turn-helix transcriptional regulator n=1 Tax=Nocardiopsis coralli TaxID=2772213 RepID=A0ABR9P8I9_9ACTN|nr:winged helix-turn-helix domain-containing protein [Nocardiopsis coralli]MBE3000157.1 winged helix-turn-helix transcriptional regulator [Nocardiopsis coralli]
MKSEGEYESELEPGFRFADDEPRWTQVARIIRDQIQRGELPPGTRVPSMIQMQQEYGISTSTGQKVHRALRSEGLIRTQSGMGSYVKRPDTTG